MVIQVFVALCLALTCNAMHQTTICMITATRPGGVSYLSHVVEAYSDQHVYHMDGVGLVIIDIDGGTRDAQTKGVALQERRLAVCDIPDIEGLPSCRVRQRTLDVSAALEKCQSITTGWVVLVEDDCHPCPTALSELIPTLATLTAQETAMAKFSRNMCATAFPVTREEAYITASMGRLYTHPHDIIYADAWASGTARVYTHNRNLFHHIGNISTEPHKNAPVWQDQYGALRADSCGDLL